MGKHKRRPWIVAIPPTKIDLAERVTIVVDAPRVTRSFRKLTLFGLFGPDDGSLVMVESVRVGPLDSGREILSGPISAEVFRIDQPETFDVPIEAGQSIAITLLDRRRSWPFGQDFFVHGVLLGKGPPK